MAAVVDPAGDRADVRAQAADAFDLDGLDERVTHCRACPRLADWREQVARSRRRAFADEEYWGRPIPGWGPADARLLVLGLAPAAHGGNRTGRIFTGDRSGDWLFAALHRVGLAASPLSTHAGDGQRLIGTRMTAAVRCAPPDNAPTTQERDTCAAWLDQEIALLAPTLRSVLALGSFAWRAALTRLAAVGWLAPRPRPTFGHGHEALLRPGPDAPAGAGDVLVVGSYHPSQQNTFTGRLTAPMLDAAVSRAAAVSALAATAARTTAAGAPSAPCWPAAGHPHPR